MKTFLKAHKWAIIYGSIGVAAVIVIALAFTWMVEPYSRDMSTFEVVKRRGMTIMGWFCGIAIIGGGIAFGASKDRDYR